MLCKYGKIILLGSVFLIGVNAFAARTYEKLCGHSKMGCENGKCGLFEDGHQGPIKYDTFQCFGAGFIVSVGGKWGLYDKRNDQVRGAIKYDAIEEGDLSYAKVKLSGKQGLLSLADGEEVLAPVYQEIEFLNNTEPYIKAKDKKGWHIFYVNDGGSQELSPTAYDAVEPVQRYYKGYYEVQSKGKKGIIKLMPPSKDQIFTEFVPVEFDVVEMPPSYQAVKVSNAGKWAFYSLISRKVTTGYYDTLEKQFSSYQVTRKGLVGLVKWDDKTQQMEEIMPPSFEQIKNIVGERLVGVSKAGKWGVYDTSKKKLVVPCQYEDVKSSMGIKEVKVKKGEEWVKQKLSE